MSARLPVIENFTARLVDAWPLGPRVRHLVFERTDGAPFTFEAGQWVLIIFPMLDEKGRPLRRAYSIASAPNSTGRFEVAITKVDDGVGSTFLHEVKPGEVLNLRGPAGTFTRVPDGGALFIATGSGVAPFRSMIHDALAKGSPAPMWLLLGVRTPEEFLYGEEFKALAARHPQLRVEPSMSRPPADWSGRSGYVQTHVAPLWKELTDTNPEAHAYICGVRKMLLAAKDVLREELHVDRKRVHLEAYD